MLSALPGAEWCDIKAIAKRRRLCNAVRGAAMRLHISEDEAWDKLRELTGRPLIVRRMDIEELRIALEKTGAIR